MGGAGGLVVVRDEAACVDRAVELRWGQLDIAEDRDLLGLGVDCEAVSLVDPEHGIVDGCGEQARGVAVLLVRHDERLEAAGVPALGSAGG